jgi:hypothetical protein
MDSILSARYTIRQIWLKTGPSHGIQTLCRGLGLDLRGFGSSRRKFPDYEFGLNRNFRWVVFRSFNPCQ